VFAVTDPQNGGQPWDIKNALPFQTAPAQLTLDIGWDPGADFTNTGSNGGSLALLTPTALGVAPASPVQVRNLTSNTVATATLCTPADCGATEANRYFAVATVKPLAFPALPRYGRVVLEGRPVCNGVPGVNCSLQVPPPPPYVSLPARTATASFTFAATAALSAMLPAAQDPRRAIVSIDKCKTCHDGNDHGTGIVPRLSLHGANRNENLAACVVCHNPNQTDVAYRRPAAAGEDPRIAGAEVPIDFKSMVHSIHSGGFRKTPFVVIGFGSSVNDFSDVRFPRKLRDCTNCHLDANGRGTFELPLAAGVLGTTIKTQSGYLATPRTIDVDPSNDVKISPIAAVCSSCHDNSEVKSHMVRTGGASFSTTQSAIGVTVRERCANCHGPGKEESVRRAHEIGGGTRSGGGD
jgi:OmcA/MtrC family decaheme c-type cytochrome